jgi:hypothetical protein
MIPRQEGVVAESECAIPLGLMVNCLESNVFESIFMREVNREIFEIYYSMIQKYPQLAGNFCKLAEFETEGSKLRGFFNSVKPVITNHKLVRIGGDSDGGYLVPDDLSGIETCFSPGVAETASFESELAKRGITCFLADYSVDAAPSENPLFHFEKKYLGSKNDSMYMTLENWVNRCARSQKDCILQMDIESSEYPVIDSTSIETLRRFRIIVVEFHELYRLCDKRGFENINAVFQKLLGEFDVVHIHPNNNCIKLTYGDFEIPSLLEITFLRKDRIQFRRPAVTFPHELDRRNIPGDDMPLPSCWYI